LRRPDRRAPHFERRAQRVLGEAPVGGSESGGRAPPIAGSAASIEPSRFRPFAGMLRPRRVPRSRPREYGRVPPPSVPPPPLSPRLGTRVLRHLPPARGPDAPPDRDPRTRRRAPRPRGAARLAGAHPPAVARARATMATLR